MRSILLCLLFLCSARAAGTPVIDGVFSDWSGSLATDPAGDASGPLDVRTLSVASHGTNLFVRIGLQNAVNLSSGPSGQASLVLSIANPGAGKTLNLNFRSRTARVNGVLQAWPVFNFACLPTFASTDFELRVDLSPISAGPGSQITLQFSGADALSSPAPFTLAGAAIAPDPLPTDRSPCALIRVASLNTFFTGLLDPAREPAITRLLRAANADVYVLQEEYDSTLADAEVYFASADLKGDGVPWSVVRSGELVIASQWPLISVPLNSSHFAAIARVPDGSDVLVANLHPKCCGYTGSDEDALRISQATEAIGAYQQFRAGTLDPALALYRSAPAILLGDWNLVGSATPLDLWRSQGMTRAPIRHSSADDFWTWASPNGLGFWPGELDLILFDRPALFAKRIFSINTASMSPAQLATLGLQASDSSASDHLLLVADFSVFAAADFNGDALVEDTDFSLFAGAYNLLDCADPAMPVGCPADLNFDGAVDDSDFVLFVGAYNELVCP